MEIYRKEWEDSGGKEVRTNDAEFLKDGTLRITGSDFGPFVDEWWGDDYEYSMEIAPEDSKKLFLSILREAFNADLRLTFTGLRKICEANGINPRIPLLGVKPNHSRQDWRNHVMRGTTLLAHPQAPTKPQSLQ